MRGQRRVVAHQHPERIGISTGENVAMRVARSDDPAKNVFELLDRRAFRSRGEMFGHRVEAVNDDLRDQVFLAFEVLVQGWFGDAYHVGQLIHIQICVPVFDQ